MCVGVQGGVGVGVAAPLGSVLGGLLGVWAEVSWILKSLHSLDWSHLEGQKHEL